MKNLHFITKKYIILTSIGINAHQLVINELLNETSSSSEDESYWDVLLITLITNAVSGKRIIAKIVNFESTVVLW
jgi:hypothetical protein